MPRYYAEKDFRKIDPLFHTMSVNAIHELDWVRMSTFTLNKRRKKLGIPHWRRPRKETSGMSTRDRAYLIRNMGGAMNHG